MQGVTECSLATQQHTPDQQTHLPTNTNVGALFWFRYFVCESFGFMFLLFDLCVRRAVSICGFYISVALFGFVLYKFVFCGVDVFPFFNRVFFDMRFPTFDFDPRLPTFDFDLCAPLRRTRRTTAELHYLLLRRLREW